MRKIYKNQFPKNMEVKSFNTKVVNGEIIVEVELKESFKDGDFLCYEGDNNNKAIFIYNSDAVDKDTVGCYVALHEINTSKYWTFDSRNYTCKAFCRYATKAEKSEFLEKLKKEYHKKWNPEKKCLEDIYVPKFGDIVKIDHSDCILYERNYIIAIVPNKDIPDSKNNDFFDIAFLDMNGGLRLTRTSPYIPDNVYPASEDEKKDLFDKLAEAGKRWNPETKKLEDIRWNPVNTFGILLY